MLYFVGDDEKSFLGAASREGEQVKAPGRRERAAASKPARDERADLSPIKDTRDAVLLRKAGDQGGTARQSFQPRPCYGAGLFVLRKNTID